MKYLGIDYGRSKIGLAVSDGKLAEPLKVIRYTDASAISEKLKQIIKQEKIEKVVVGVSEGEMAEESKKFGLGLNLQPLVLEFFDETLSSHDAQELSRQTGMSRKKRRELEDAFAASIMLQSYIDYV